MFGSHTKVFLSKLLVAIEKLFISVNVGASTHAVTLQSTYHLVIWYCQFLFLQLPTAVCIVHSVTPWSPRTTLNWLLMLRQLPSSPACSVQQQQHWTINHCCQMPGQSSVIACTADDWDEQCKWSRSGLYLITRDRRVFPAIWSRSNADRGKP